jgi:protein gp37
MNETGIIWTEATWNPMSGCQKISPGCKHCYAFDLAENKRGTLAFPDGFDLTIRPHKLREPFKLKKPTLIFTNSMSDLFWDKVSNDYRHQIIDVIEQTPQHEYQVLTKRPDALLKFSKERKLPPNFWAGTTIENQDTYEKRLDTLREVNAEIHFISFEPLIQYVDVGSLKGIDWVITGGESGIHMWNQEVQMKRGLVRYDRTLKKWFPIDERIDWVRVIRDQCILDGVHFFHKQWGGNYPEAAGRMLDGRTWNDIPRLPGNRTEIQNSYLKLLESKK